ncbi:MULTISPECIES: glutathione S-transferase family protein [Burkholderiaceae]|uniref:glutathione S-transferase family protein n=1 Tax=Burkholderiaceae TaxID=119060 RepID=UPI00076B8592|nr:MULTISPECIES: glutathione S-transferase family protein [Burkholderiaceae]AME27100.1 glutathione S-transferase [Burkholderia sp. PAMC 26561]AME27755.1 glutathione S-transferase [Burkholderia sp. PAMC 26561]
MSTSLELYGAKTGNCLRVSIALEEASLSYKIRPMDLAGGQQRAEEHLSLNPAGKVPVLVERRACGSRFVLTQSNAILLYIAQKSCSCLLPDDPQNRGRAYERFFYFVTDVIAPNHASFALRDRSSSQAASLLNERAIAALKFADTFVRRSRYMAGDQFSIADICALTITGSLSSGLDWRAVPNLQRWFYDVAERPSVQRGLKAFDGI